MQATRPQHCAPSCNDILQCQDAAAASQKGLQVLPRQRQADTSCCFCCCWRRICCSSSKHCASAACALASACTSCFCIAACLLCTFLTSLDLRGQTCRVSSTAAGMLTAFMLIGTSYSANSTNPKPYNDVAAPQELMPPEWVGP